MFTVSRFYVENMQEGCVTDAEQPRFGFSLLNSRCNAVLDHAELQLGDWQIRTNEQVGILGPRLAPFTTYHARLTATDDEAQTAEAELTFETGRMGTPWQAQWISDPRYRFRAKRISPKPMVFRKTFACRKKVAWARLYATALGIYDLSWNGKRLGDRYFAPGFTSYAHTLQYQTYDVTALVECENEITAEVAGGWAVGSFVFTRKNRHDADRQAFLAELRIRYTDGSTLVIGTDGTWEVTTDGKCIMADFYDGEDYDARINPEFHPAAPEKLRIRPQLLAESGAPVHPIQELTPVSFKKAPDGGDIYDFGQNFAGVVKLHIRGRAGQKIIIRHAEILNPDGSLNTAFLRSARASVHYICREGEQDYSPRFTYMGFRYVSVQGIAREDLDITALALSSAGEQIGDFSCSNPLLNQLQSNILWGARSNLLDIPTDCPQRDERMGWTGDIAVFGPTACFNFEINRFLDKWLRDVRSEQFVTGGIPNTVPAQGYCFPATMPPMAVDWWGDACVLVPWAQYQATGDKTVLEENYETMKRYCKACAFWAKLAGFGHKKYIWNTPSVFHFGDWVAPDVPKMQQWQARAPWTATASLCNTAAITAWIAVILGKNKDAQELALFSRKAADAYCREFTDGNGRLKTEFQTAYVLPLYLGMFPLEQRQAAADNLAQLVKKNSYCIGTGFPGTPYILFALADHGHLEDAYKMLLNTQCPSWLYEVKSGATTIWERWDGLDENGLCPIGDDGTDTMISYNHYASGAVGDFLYRRVVGIEAVDPGYRNFRVAPKPGGDLTWAKAHTRSPYGEIAAQWKLDENHFTVTVTVPMGTRCHLELPDGTALELGSGTWERACEI